MKYPKLRDGSNAVGESQIRQLSGIDTPFLKKAGPNSISYTRNGFPEVHQKTGEPYLWGTYVTILPEIGSARILTALLSPEDRIALSVYYKATYTLSGLNTDASEFKVFVGDNYVMRLFAHQQDVDDPDTLFWPSIARCDSLGTEFHATEEGHERHSISYTDSVLLTGLGLFKHGFSLYGCGWEDAEKRFRFGLGCNYFTDPLNPETTRAPVHFVGSTGEYEMVQVAYPAYSGRDHYRATRFTVGPGKVLCLHAVREDTSLTAIPAYLVRSNDFGETWTGSFPTFLLDAQYLYPASGPTRAHYDVVQLETMSLYTTATYVGDGKFMLVLPNCYVDGDIDLLTARFCPALYLCDDSSYTRVAWPGDTWYCDRAGIPIAPLTDKSGFTYMQVLRSAQFSMGVGCFHAPVYQDGAWRVLSTRNWGASWTYSPAVPLEFLAPGLDFAGTVVLPYLSPEKPGRMVFSAPDYVENKLRFYYATGNFDEFVEIGHVVKAKGDLISTGLEATNYYFVNYGGKRFKPCVFPAFPDEFNKP